MKASTTDRSAALSKDGTLSLEWLDLAALTRYVAVSERTLREWIHRVVDPLPACQVEKKILVRRSAFDRWLERHPVQSFDLDKIEETVSDVLSGLVKENH
jgi:hypothetical protein